MIVHSYKTFYQGPSQLSSLVLSQFDDVEHCDFYHVGWSLLRSFTSFKYEALLVLGGFNLVDNCRFYSR